MAETDISWISDGFYVSFFPETDAGKIAWEEMLEHSEGTARFPKYMFPSIKTQLKAAGYTVRKSRPKKVDIDQLLKELNELT